MALKKAGPLKGPRIKDFEHIMKYLKKHGTVQIECPYGLGFYTINLDPKYNVYKFPDVLFYAYLKTTYSPKAAVRSLMTRSGLQLMWYPMGVGWEGRLMNWPRFSREDRLKQVETPISMILAGVQLYKVACGSQVNSETANIWKDKKTIGLISGYHY